MYIIVMSTFNSCDYMFLLCFQCGEWIRVRVHQMEPDLMEVGSTVEEALQLQAEHDQLLSKLQVSNTPPLLGHFFSIPVYILQHYFHSQSIRTVTKNNNYYYLCVDQ